MLPRIKEVKHRDGYRLDIVFSDGLAGTLDFRARVVGRGGVFEALEDSAFFGQVRVDDEVGTIEWPNGVDFCPDVLYQELLEQQAAA